MIEQREENGILIVVPVIDAISSGQAAAQIAEIRNLAKDNHNKMVIDLHKVLFIDSFGLALLFNLHKNYSQHGKMALANLGSQPLSILKLSQIDSLIKIYASVDEACAALAS